MRLFLLTLTFFLFTSISFGQEVNLAAIVDEKTHEVDIVFISKIVVMLFIGIVALISYLKFKKSDFN